MYLGGNLAFQQRINMTIEVIQESLLLHSKKEVKGTEAQGSRPICIHIYAAQ